jgi:hypothetical protein
MSKPKNFCFGLGLESMSQASIPPSSQMAIKIICEWRTTAIVTLSADAKSGFRQAPASPSCIKYYSMRRYIDLLL